MNVKFCLALSILSQVFLGCEDEMPEKNSHRVAEAYFHGGEDRKSTYFYDRERLIRIDGFLMVDSGEWKMTSSIEYQYQDNDVSETLFELTGGIWMATERRTHVLESGRTMEQTYSVYDDDVWRIFTRYEFRYAGDDLMEYVRYSGPAVNDDLVPDLWQLYNYRDNNLQEVLTYRGNNGVWSLIRRLEANYSGDDISEYLYFRVDMTPDEPIERPEKKGVFTFDDGLLKKVDYHGWDPQTGDWYSQGYHTDEYTYNSEGYLTSVQRSNNSGNTYVYEEGHGNASQFRLFPDNNIFVFPGLKSAYISHFGQIKPYP